MARKHKARKHKARKRTGRPSKLTIDVRKRLALAVQLGSTFTHASQFAGIDYTTYRRYMVRGEEELRRRHEGGSAKSETAKREQPFLDLYEAVRKADAHNVMRLLMIIEEASATHWQAAAWKLERRFPKEYGRQISTVAFEDVDLAGMTDDELMAYIAKLGPGSSR